MYGAAVAVGRTEWILYICARACEAVWAHGDTIEFEIEAQNVYDELLYQNDKHDPQYILYVRLINNKVLFGFWQKRKRKIEKKKSHSQINCSRGNKQSFEPRCTRLNCVYIWTDNYRAAANPLSATLSPNIYAFNTSQFDWKKASAKTLNEQ